MPRTGSQSLDPPESDVPVSIGFSPGQRIAGKYQLIRPLDQGGMGVVWVAHHLDLDVQVALKVVHTEGEPIELGERLLREAQAAARIDHPAVVRVLDTGRTNGGDPFLVMELLDGEAMGSVLARDRRLEPIAAVRTLLPIIGALLTLHGRSMIHRDIKPENIFLARDDSGRWRPKLIDFGLARTSMSRITQRGMVMGTPAYLAPEQLRGADADHLTDIWGICAVLYEAVTGVRPFVGDTYMEILTLSIGKVAPFSAHGVDEPELWTIVERGLAPAAKRWQSARELGRALSVWLWDRGVTDDLSGVSLRSTWLEDDDVRRVGSRVKTASFPARIEMAPPSSPPPSVEISPRSTATTMMAPAREAPPATPSTMPVESSPRETRRTPVLALAGGAAAVIAVGIALVSMRSVTLSQGATPIVSAPTPLASSVAPPAVTPVVTPASAAAPTVSAAPAPPPPPAITATASAAPPKVKGPLRKPGSELKNPFE
ncbi:serine/threonine protein kinase [Minicystis rosea]|nr:serine/threonine protein kinase [Minicystis rosea]